MAASAERGGRYSVNLWHLGKKQFLVGYLRHSGHHIGLKDDARHPPSPLTDSKSRARKSAEYGRRRADMKFRHVPALVPAMPGLAPEIDNIVAFLAAAEKQEPEDQAAGSQ
jgi:hypothetical protein